VLAAPILMPVAVSIWNKAWRPRTLSSVQGGLRDRYGRWTATRIITSTWNGNGVLIDAKPSAFAETLCDLDSARELGGEKDRTARNRPPLCIYGLGS